ncbi:unnamed protein product [Paramecium sonneborni]|uniref:Uncharacterized protein n=1 Tax=Paramecium sonneborni TaxID=65129 RepID=A0A8S1QJT2_9CILI|nr:unnamed protein product [Paramecium sonneborni]
MGQDCCSLRNPENSSIGQMNGVSNRKSIQDGKKRLSHIKDEEIIEVIQEYKENKQIDNNDEQNDNQKKTPLFQVVNSEVHIPMIESQVIEQEKVVENNNLVPDKDENQCQKEEKVVENKKESVEKSNFAEIKVEQEMIASKQIETQNIDEMLIQNKEIKVEQEITTSNQIETQIIDEMLIENKEIKVEQEIMTSKQIETQIIDEMLIQNKEIKVEQEITTSKQIETQIIDKILIENKLIPEQISFSTSFDTVKQQSQSNIEQSLKNRATPGKLSSIFLRALERKILGIEVEQDQKQEEIVPIVERPIPKVRPRKIQQFVEL